MKPFSYNELISRVKAMLRRYTVYGSKQLPQNTILRCCGDIEIDTVQHLVKRNGADVNFTETEYQILLLLASSPKKVFSAQNIYESIWKEPYYSAYNNNVMVHIRNIRTV